MGRYRTKYDFEVEDCLTLSMKDLRKGGYLKASESTLCHWVDEGFSNPTARIISTITGTSEGNRLTVVYRHINGGTGSVEDIRTDYDLATTPCYYGRYRYWFKCYRCYRRVFKLYLTPDNPQFLCRFCHNLTYYLCRHQRNC